MKTYTEAAQKELDEFNPAHFDCQNEAEEMERNLLQQLDLSRKLDFDLGWAEFEACEQMGWDAAAESGVFIIDGETFS